jgi:hypothetical protein
VRRKISMRTFFVVGFDCGDFFNTYGSSWTKHGAEVIAAEAEKEYDEKPIIKRVKLEEK